MLSEYKTVRQISEEGYRRWFSDDWSDLIVWYEDDTAQTIIGFQLCYDKQGYERALTCRNGKITSHAAVEQGETNQANRSPIMVADGFFDTVMVTEKFLTISKELDEDIKNYVLSTLKQV